jgi:hypothetical protein
MMIIGCDFHPSWQQVSLRFLSRGALESNKRSHCGICLTHPERSNKLKTFHFEPNLWQTAFMSSFLMEA